VDLHLERVKTIGDNGLTNVKMICALACLVAMCLLMLCGQAHAALSLGNHNINATDSGTTSNTITITSWSANDILIVVAPSQISTSVSSITDNSGQGLSWAQRADSTGAFHVETWWARVPSNSFATVIITVNYTGGTPTYNPLIVFAVSGAVTSGSPFDGTASTSTSDNASYTTTHDQMGDTHATGPHARPVVFPGIFG
jgi:hypothetical protein